MYASATGLRIVRGWDISSGNELQLQLERKTHLISTVLAYLFALSLFTLFLFIYTADHVHHLFVGAMCAAGSLNVNKFGYPALVMKAVNFFFCGVWLILNYADNQGHDYPLIKDKYKLLMLISALLALETYLVINYFMGLKPNVITSCCGTLFSTDHNSIAGGLSSLPTIPAKVMFYLSFVLMLRAGIHFFITGKGARIFSGLSTLLFMISIMAIIAFISLYYYEIPTHHCPFCLLQKEYHFIGYPLYLSLLGAGIMGAGVGLIDRFKNTLSLHTVIPGLQKKLCVLSTVAYIIFLLISSYPMVFSDFILEGY